MPRILRALHTLSVLALLCLARTATAQESSPAIRAESAEVGGLTVHYLASGQGPSVILLHGYTQTSRMWRPIIPLLAKRFSVIAPDLPGIGESEIPADGYDMKTAASRMHDLARSLNIQKASVVGHDIGLMVAYAYAAQFPTEVEKLVVLDAFLPGVGNWEAVYYNPGNWHFFFLGPTPDLLVKGRERTYFEHYWNDFAADPKRSLSEQDRQAYTKAYARSGRIRAGWGYFAAFPQTAKQFAEFAKTKLGMPVLVMGGEKASASALVAQVKLVAANVTAVVLKDTGHWLMEEQPKQTMDALTSFL